VIATLAADANYSGATSAPYAFTITAASSTITVTGATTYTYNANPQGPATNTKTGSTGAVTYSYAGTGSTTYTASATAPTNVGTYQVIATLAADANYSGATSAPYAFTITAASSTITVTGATTYTYNGSPQGPATNTKTGSTGAVTYSYVGTGSTTYGPSATAPTNVGSYQVIATLAADANYSGAASAPYAFTITAASSTITVTGLTTYTYNANPQGPASNTKTGSTGAVTYSYVGIGSTTYGSSATAPTNVGTYQVIATLAADANYSGATSAPYAFTITAAGSTIVVTGANTYTFNGSAQGPTTNTKTGSTGAVTYSYVGTGSTTYGPSATPPTNAGTYQVIATLASDGTHNGATSAPYAFTINKLAPVVSLADIVKTMGDPNFTINATSTSSGSITYSIVNANIATVNSNTVSLAGVGVTTITVAQAETENYTAATTTASLTVKPAAPSTTPGSYVIGNPSNPSNTTGLISPNPGATLNFYSVATGGTASSVQPLPAIVGVYTFYVSQTINGIEGPRVPYTVTILPSITVKSNTYIVGAINNPSNISSLVIGITNGSKPRWCNASGLNCTDVAPALPSTPGVYIWCVKAVDIATGLESSGCVYDTVTILAPATVMAVQKRASALTLQPDGTYTMDFTFTLTNNLSVTLDSIQLIDNLSAVFTSPSTYKVISVTASGTLVASTTFNGSSVTNLLLPASKLGANKSETVVLRLQVLPQTYAGTLTNNVTAFALSPYGTFGSPASTTFVVPAVSLFISDVITPNQDGKNDQWIIVKPSNKQLRVEIVNRWGQRVFANSDYQNNFVGRGTGSFLGQDLAEGTYFYFIEIVDRVTGVKEFRKGYLTLKR
jgi:gliding motility-associated-like protein